MNCQDPLAWVQKKKAEEFLGHADWCLARVKELQSIVDCTKFLDTTHSAAIDPQQIRVWATPSAARR